MKPITINELAAIVQQLQENGMGEYVVCVSDDEEFNGYHCLWNTDVYLGAPQYYTNNGKNEVSKSIVFT